MSIFASEDDAIRFAIRRIYHDVLHREIESVDQHNNWVAEWRAKGGDAVLAQIIDSPEGAQCMSATRKALGLPDL